MYSRLDTAPSPSPCEHCSSLISLVTHIIYLPGSTQETFYDRVPNMFQRHSDSEFHLPRPSHYWICVDLDTTSFIIPAAVDMPRQVLTATRQHNLRYQSVQMDSAYEPNPNSSADCLNSQYSSLQLEQMWPSYWTISQKDDFTSKNNWLFYNNGKLGCTTRRGVGSIGVKKEMGVKISKEWRLTVFRTACKIANKNQSFYNFEDVINLQELNGIDKGRILHSTNACISIVNHIGK
ncbi:hypothetical protein PR048_025381 [Dryococelus australis]|uniref:Uncharacterized protein n=1 Tax=Dryococelus australis TaxID=614101 RepID=A0ABQ9GR97_9NEOP|nr:hypothetical protein PR048_025381 [Dryococelus australis]